jgi:four helix bundle protein
MLRDFLAFQLAKELHWECKTLRLQRYLQDELLRASSSVALNIAEGSGKRTPQDQRRFYSIALGSLRECEAIVELERIQAPGVLERIDRLGGILFNLSRPPENRNRTQTQSQTQTPTQTE